MTIITKMTVIVTILCIFNPVTLTHPVCYPYTHPIWDHAENEDKHLISHVASWNPVELNNSESTGLTHHISNVSNDTLNLSENRVSSLSISYISYFCQVFPVHLNRFSNLFPKSFKEFIENLKNYIDSSLVRFRYYLNYFSCTFSYLTSHIPSIQAIASLVTDLPCLINKVLSKLKETIEKNMTDLCSNINEIFKSIRSCNVNIKEAIKDIKDINNLISTKFKNSIITCFKECLKEIWSKLRKLWLELHQLYYCYYPINCLIKETQKTIQSFNNNIWGLKTQIPKLIKKFECAICEINKIESKLASAKQKVDEITKLKPEVSENCESNGTKITVTFKCNNGRTTTIVKLNSSNGNSLKPKIKSLCDEIENLCSKFTEIDTNTTQLKKSIEFSSCCFQIADRILNELECIQSSVESINGKIYDIKNLPSHSSVISHNIKYIKDVIDMVNEHRDDLRYLRDNMNSIMPKIRQINNIGINIKRLCFISECLNSIKTGIQKLKEIESEEKWNEICKSVCENGQVTQTLVNCIKEKLDINSITSKFCIVHNGVNSLECVIPKLKELFTYIESLSNAINNIVEWIDDNKLNDIIKRFIICSLKSLSNHLTNSNTSSFSGVEKNPITKIYSLSHVTHYNVVVNILFQFSKKMDRMFHLIPSAYGCKCILSLEKATGNTISLSDTNVSNIIEKMASNSKNDFNKEFKLDQITGVTRLGGDANHFCLCIINKYILYPQLIKLMYLFEIDLDSLSTMSRKFDKYVFSKEVNQNISLFLILVIELLYKVGMYILSKYEYKTKIDRQVEIICLCKYSSDTYYPYLLSILLWVSSLIENLWTADKNWVLPAINHLSSLLSEYQSIHVYTNYYTSGYKILGNLLSGSNNGKLTQRSGSLSGLKIVEENGQSLVISNIKSRITISESNQKGATTTSYAIKKDASGLLKKSINGGFISVSTIILGTHFSKDKFSLIYDKLSSLWFYTQNCNVFNTDTTTTLKNIAIHMSLNYLEKICQQCQPQCHCTKNKECKLCPKRKIGISCLSISLKRIEMVLGDVKSDMLLNYLMGSITTSEDFFSNLCVGFGEVYTAMTKNNYGTYTDHKNIANSFPSLTMGYEYGYLHKNSMFNKISNSNT